MYVHHKEQIRWQHVVVVVVVSPWFDFIVFVVDNAAYQVDANNKEAEEIKLRRIQLCFRCSVRVIELVCTERPRSKLSCRARSVCLSVSLSSVPFTTACRVLLGRKNNESSESSSSSIGSHVVPAAKQHKKNYWGAVCIPYIVRHHSSSIRRALSWMELSSVSIYPLVFVLGSISGVVAR